MTTLAERKELRRLHEEASAAPWRQTADLIAVATAYTDPDGNLSRDNWQANGAAKLIAITGEKKWADGADDARLITAMRNALPSLLDMADRLEEVEKLAVGLAAALVKLDQHIDFGEPMTNGEACHWENAAGINDAMEEARASLSSPLLATLRTHPTPEVRQDEPCPVCDGNGRHLVMDPDTGSAAKERCTDCCGTGKKEARHNV